MSSCQEFFPVKRTSQELDPANRISARNVKAAGLWAQARVGKTPESCRRSKLEQVTGLKVFLISFAYPHAILGFP